MTIHQAKGLEFPLVVVPDLERPTRRTTQSAAFTRQWGPVVRTTETSGFELYAYAESEEDAAELVRLFYVATTRAADYLILSSGVTAIGTCKGPWLELLAERFDLQTGALRVPLPAGYAVPQIRVIASEPAAEKPQGTAVRRDLAKLAQAAVELAVKDGGHVPPHFAHRRRHRRPAAVLLLPPERPIAPRGPPPRFRPRTIRRPRPNRVSILWDWVRWCMPCWPRWIRR